MDPGGDEAAGSVEGTGGSERLNLVARRAIHVEVEEGVPAPTAPGEQVSVQMDALVDAKR
eukprot:COSAG02_NODE_2462_length_8788_cov_3.780297_2_plen_60_part_00